MSRYFSQACSNAVLGICSPYSSGSHLGPLDLGHTPRFQRPNKMDHPIVIYCWNRYHVVSFGYMYLAFPAHMRVHCNIFFTIDRSINIVLFIIYLLI